MNIGIIGNGFVGNAINFAFSSISNIKIFDIDPKKSLDSLESVNKCDFVFICVPTPMFKDGSQDLSCILNVLNDLSKGPIYILKSTVLPGTTEKLLKNYPDLKFVFSPEFLTEKNSVSDMQNLHRTILGGELKYTTLVKKLFLKRYPNVNIIETDFKNAEYAKYMNNAFLATKVSIMNEFKLLSDKIGADWEITKEIFLSDKRIGKSHINVPGHDGKLGYGGTCFPKDVNALLSFAKSKDIEMNTILAGWKTNLKLRPEKDWENNFGRSVSYKKNKKKTNYELK